MAFLVILSVCLFDVQNLTVQDNSNTIIPDLIPYRKGDKWGFVDKDGKEVTPFKYDKVSYMHDGSAKVELNGKHGFIDKNGTEYREE